MTNKCVFISGNPSRGGGRPQPSPSPCPSTGWDVTNLEGESSIIISILSNIISIIISNIIFITTPCSMLIKHLCLFVCLFAVLCIQAWQDWVIPHLQIHHRSPQESCLPTFKLDLFKRVVNASSNVQTWWGKENLTAVTHFTRQP